MSPKGKSKAELLAQIDRMQAQIDELQSRVNLIDFTTDHDRLFATILEHCTVSVTVIRDDRFVFANPAAALLTGYAVEELLGKPALFNIHHADRDRIMRAFFAMKRGDTIPSEYRFRIVRSNGEQRWVDVAVTQIDLDGESTMLSAAIDITEYIAASEQLTSSRDFLSRLIENLPGVVYRCMPDHRRKMEYLSEYFPTLTGHPIAQFVGTDAVPYSDLIHQDDRDWVAEEIERCARSQSSLNIAYRILHAEGEPRWINERGIAITDEYGTTTAIEGFITDITDRKRAENQLLQASKMASIGVLVSGVAHEINNPNNFISLNAGIMSKVWRDVAPILDEYSEQHALTLSGLPYFKARAKIPQLIDGISEGAARIEKIVRSLRNFSKQDPGSLDQQVDLNRVVENAATIVQNKIRKSTDRFVVEHDNALPMITGNRQQLEQVVINLIANACDALTSTDQGLMVRLRNGVKQGFVTLEIIDEGKGMTEVELKNVFDPFYTTKRDTGGTGLGLSVSYRIINEHQGTIQFASRPATGTKVTVHLPIGDQAVTAPRKIQ